MLQVNSAVQRPIMIKRENDPEPVPVEVEDHTRVQDVLEANGLEYFTLLYVNQLVR